MQIIKSNNIINVEGMTNEDSNYPKENAISKQPKQIAKSTSTSTKIIMSAGSFLNIAFFNVDSDTGKLEIVDHDSGIPVIKGTDIAVTGSNTITSSSSDLSVLSDGDKFLMYGFDSDSNNQELTVSGTPTSTSLTTVETVLTTESAGNNITIVRFNDADKAINQDINFSYCKTYTDYFSGNSINIDQYYKEFSNNYLDASIQITLTGTFPSIGLVYAGLGRVYGVSQYGSSKNINDNSIYRETINGSLNQVVRNVNIDATVQVSCSRQEAVALENLWKYDNENYKVFMLKYDSEDGLLSQLLLYGKIIKKPRLTWRLPDRFGYTVEIKSIGGYQ